MARKSRSGKKANKLEKARAAHKQRPVPAETQAEIAAQNAAAHRRRYPVPPLYRLSYDHPNPVQPICYPTRYGA